MKPKIKLFINIDMGKGYLHDPKTRFSSRVENYVKYRPRYPIEIINYLVSEKILTQETLIADIGSGTGILSKLFLDNGNTVYGIEPNNEMRIAAEEYLVNYPGFASINGSAEKTGLNDNSLDMITVGQAFHWFEFEQTKIEFKRILKANGYLVIIWNSRKKLDSDFSIAYENLVSKYGADYKEVRMNESKVDDFFEYKLKTFQNYQDLDFEGFKGRILSASYMPLENSPNYNDLLKEIKIIFETHKQDEKIRIEYNTELYYGVL